LRDKAELRAMTPSNARSSRFRAAPIHVASFGMLVLSVPWLVLALDDRAARGPAGSAASDAEDRRAAEAALTGAWWKADATAETDVVRFWYFHGDGHGLYRYGHVGLTNTHAFDYAGDGQVLQLTFRKTGEVVRVPYRIERDGPRPTLVLLDDPREGGEQRYTLRPAGAGAGAQTGATADAGAGADGGAAGTDAAELEAGVRIDHRLWIDVRRFRQGGLGFAMYQLQRAGIDGRGTGWFHRGDFDEWTTETLVYRAREGALELQFPLAREQVLTTFVVEGEGDDRTLIVADDPRDFGLHHRYRDGGPTFASPTDLDPGALLDRVAALAVAD
jgi:hypothetical protein